MNESWAIMKNSLKNIGNSFYIKHLVSIFNNLEDMMILFEIKEDGILRCVEVNRAFTNIMGIRHECVKSKQLNELFNEEETTYLLEKYKEAIIKRETLTFEIGVYASNQRKTFETTIIPIFLEPSPSCCYLVGILKDISERKRYEQTLLEAKQELETLIQYQQGLILKVEKRGEDFFYIFCEGQLVAQFDLTPDDVIGKRPQDLFPPAIAANVIEQYKSCWKRKENFFYEWADSIDDFEFCWLANLSPIIEAGQIKSFIIYAVDILERKKTEQSLIKSEKLALIGELAAGVGHEIRNPLTSIKGFIKLMMENKDAIKDEFFEIIDSELESINRIAGELMILAKPQANEFKRIDIVELLNEVLFLIEAETFRYGVELIRNFPASQVFINGDKQQLKQVVMNLVKNSIEAMESNSKGRIIIDCRTEGAMVVVKIMDNGCGIPQKLLEKIGEPFYTTKEKGTGLGLMVSYRIIKSHVGNIVCESEEGEGTTFVLSFPVNSH
ncbi:MAG: ATP-binding protein [Bacillota bacterium]|nr:ATP-binding protein [Bacillota bacterium]